MGVIITTGKFAILHAGHFNLLMRCRALADNLKDGSKVVVLLDSDSRIKDRDGELPIFSENERAHHLRMLDTVHYTRVVDNVFIVYNDQHLEDMIKEFKPTHLVKGSEWKNQNVIGQKYALSMIYSETKDVFGYQKLSDTHIVARIRQGYVKESDLEQKTKQDDSEQTLQTAPQEGGQGHQWDSQALVHGHQSEQPESADDNAGSKPGLIKKRKK